jgi:GH15 family glucan-1,4-alpha-glucosidase
MSMNLNLGVIGNCIYNALINDKGQMVWCCMPRFDGDPVFNALLQDGGINDEDRQGLFSVDLEDLVTTEQFYKTNTAILVTRLTDARGGAIEITDFAPRFRQYGRMYRPIAIVRKIRSIAGTPRIRIRVRPTFEYGAVAPECTHGSNHIRYVGPRYAFRLTTDAPLIYVLNETWFHAEEPLTLFLGPDETWTRSVTEATDEYLAKTEQHWKEWARHLALPLEWQQQVIRSAITLKLCWYEETGAIIAAMTTSIPESVDSGRNWDYRYCWLRDAYYVVQSLNRLGVIDIMESYLVYLRNLAGIVEDRHLKPVYGIDLAGDLTEHTVDSLPGYRGMGPVRRGNQAHEHLQHDVYGQVVLSAAQAFFDERILRPMRESDYVMLETVADKAFEVHDQPDASLWELRTKSRVHTYSSVMCWAACDRMSKIAQHLGKSDPSVFWRERASVIKKKVDAEAFNSELGSFTSAFGGDEIDASLLQLAPLGFVEGGDPRYIGTVAVIERELLHDGHLFRYVAADDFGKPRNAFNVCTFWYIEALHALGRTDDARSIFNGMLEATNHLGLLSEDFDVKKREMWGNFPQTYSLVGIINAAMLLSRPWGSVL